MKFSLTFKHPDVLEQIDDLEDNERLEAQTFAEKFLKYQEYLIVDFDTEAKTATVREV
jgi:hypothetical protein